MSSPLQRPSRETARSDEEEHPETIYFVGLDDPSEGEIQAWIARLLAEGRIEEGGYSLRWVTLNSGVRKPAVNGAQDSGLRMKP